MSTSSRVIFCRAASRTAILTLLLPAAFSLDGCGEPTLGPPADEPPTEEIHIDSVDPRGVLAGRFSTPNETIRFEVRFSDIEQSVRLTSGTTETLMFVIDEASGDASIVVGRSTVEVGQPYPAAAEADIRAFAASPSGRALVTAAGQSFWAAPSAELLEHRHALIAAYSQLAPYYTPQQKALVQPPGTTSTSCVLDRCQLRTPDALFGCLLDDNGTRLDVVPLSGPLPDECAVTIAGRALVGARRQALHESLDCYGACGYGCNEQTGCRRVTISCRNDIAWEQTPPLEGAHGVSEAVVCYESRLPIRALSRELRDLSDCGAQDATAVGEVLACTSHDCCFRHDECMRHDFRNSVAGYFEWLQCQYAGEAACSVSYQYLLPRIRSGVLAFTRWERNGLALSGLRAVAGTPLAGWELKWFRGDERPLTDPLLGSDACNWVWQCDDGACAGRLQTQASTLPYNEPENEQRACLVHECKHQDDHTCPGDNGSELPPTPANLAAIYRDSQGDVFITWNEVAEATHYRLYWATSPGVTASSNQLTPMTADFRHTGVGAGLTYYYRVSAINDAGEGALSDEVSETVPVSTPSAPLNVSVVHQAAQSRNFVVWSEVAGATQYRVYWGRAAGITGASMQLPPTTTTGSEHMGVTAGSVYYYRVSAVGAGGEGPLSVEVSITVPVTPPDVPSNVAVIHQASQARNRVSWDAVAGATGYRVYWDTAAGVTASGMQLSPTSSTQHGHTGLVPGSSYYYRVSAVSGGSEGPLSAEVSVTVPGPVQPPPNVAVVYQSSQVRNHVTWDAVASATQYRVYWNTVAGVTSSSMQLSPTARTEYGHTGLTPGSSYFYRVSAVVGGSEGPLSAEVSVAVPAPVPAPLNVSVVYQPAQTRNYITWNSVSGATQYRVYWSTVPGVTTASMPLTPTTTTEYGHTGVAPGSTYYYRVSAVSGGPEGALSAEVSVTVPAAPQAPSNAAVVYQGPQMRNYITWEAVSGATGYRVYWSTISGVTTSSMQLPLTSTTDYGHTGVVAGATYYYRISAVGIGGEGPLSSEISVTVPTPLLAPSNVAVVHQAAQSWNYVTWNAVAGATQYRVYWGTSSGVTTSSNLLTPTTTTDYGHTGVVAGSTYFYRVAAVNAAGVGPLSSEVSVTIPTAPGVPSNVTVVYQAAQSWNYVTWNAVAGATQYRVYWGTSSGVTTASNLLTPTTTTDYGHTGIVAGSTYYYRIAAVNAAGVGPLSSEVSVTIPTPPGVPSNVAVVYQAAQSRNYITWNAVTGATQYRVYWGTSSGVTTASNLLTPTTTTDYGHTGVVAGFTYYYRVAAMNAAGVGPLSSEVSVTIPTPPGVPSNVAVVYQAAQSWNYVTWNAVAGATEYRVYWGTSSGVTTASNLLTPTTTTDYGHTGVLAGSTYYYRVAAVNAAGLGSLSSEASVTVPCGASGQACCSGSCNSGNLCISGSCAAEPTSTKTNRFVNHCNSNHWQSNRSCYPGSSPTTGCGCATRVTNSSCSASTQTCWERELGFWTYDSRPSFGSFFEIHHCFTNGANVYQTSPCSTAGDPASLGWIASSPISIWDDPVWLCQWTTGGVTEHFFSFSSSECTSVGTVVGPSPWGYVVP